MQQSPRVDKISRARNVGNRSRRSIVVPVVGTVPRSPNKGLPCPAKRRLIGESTKRKRVEACGYTRVYYLQRRRRRRLLM